MQGRVSPGGNQPLPEGGSDGGAGGPPAEAKHAAGSNSDGDGRTSWIRGVISALMPSLSALMSSLILAIATAVTLGIFHQCTFAMPAMQRDIAEVKTSQAEVKLMIQRLCVAMGRPEYALPPNACT